MRVLGRKLLLNENVHHKDGNKLNNNPNNLELWIKPQPHGIKVEDAIKWAKNIIRLYGK
jgi:HNH endonuclease